MGWDLVNIDYSAFTDADWISNALAKKGIDVAKIR